jgi:hypothetical protein
MKTGIGPVRVDGIPCRLIEFEDGRGRIESWVNGRWVPGGATIIRLMKGAPCADPETAGMNSENPVVSVISPPCRVLDLREGLRTWAVPVVFVLGMATLLYFVRHELTALPW